MTGALYLMALLNLGVSYERGADDLLNRVE